ncbi:hypothetical protein NQ317_018193 [Molorchus minor]|uniref:Uncharacterized protein n=1 Tax=Molorchus minor TaxID=1323400 RepID=A0ABQ9JWU0_9CUCU|nr:hypothetical protein NQ317_018193 [Molorchus minor]
MDVCISHVIGTTAPSTPESGFMSSPRSGLDHIRTRSRSRGSPPSPRPTYVSPRSWASRKTSMEQHSPGVDFVDAVNVSVNGSSGNGTNCVRIKLPPNSRAEHYREAVGNLDSELDNKLRNMNLIGKPLGAVPRINATFTGGPSLSHGRGA